MAATIKDIARATGLGLATISSYLNGGNVREKNRIKIQKAIEELHFEVNETARGLRTNLTRTVGVVIPELTMVFCAEIITAMEDIRLPDRCEAGTGGCGISCSQTGGWVDQYARGQDGRTSGGVQADRKASGADRQKDPGTCLRQYSGG